MSTDFNIKPVGVVPVAAPVVRPQPEAARVAVRTELPAPKAPSAVDPSVRIRSEQLRNQQRLESDNVSRRIVVDRDAAEIVYRVVDNRTSFVVRQYPDETRLRLRAYQRTQDVAKAAKLKDTQAKFDQSA